MIIKGTQDPERSRGILTELAGWERPSIPFIIGGVLLKPIIGPQIDPQHSMRAWMGDVLRGGWTRLTSAPDSPIEELKTQEAAEFFEADPTFGHDNADNGINQTTAARKGLVGRLLMTASKSAQNVVLHHVGTIDHTAEEASRLIETTMYRNNPGER